MLEDQLEAYRIRGRVTTKGALAVVLFVTRQARLHGLPLDPSALKADSAGQIAGLSRSAIQAILADYGITQILAAEGGRTSRGSLRKMEEYVEVLNRLQADDPPDLADVERWWVQQVRAFFASKPFFLRLDAGVSAQTALLDLFEQAKQRQKENPGTMYAGALLQHLVGARLALLAGDTFETHGFSVADAPTGRAGDFILGDTVVHVTTAPSEALMEKCRANLRAGLRPLLLTRREKVLAAWQLAEIGQLADRLEILDAEQWLAAGLHEACGFGARGMRDAAEQLAEQYNKLVDRLETDPSLRIQLG